MGKSSLGLIFEFWLAHCSGLSAKIRKVTVSSIRTTCCQIWKKHEKSKPVHVPYSWQSLIRLIHQTCIHQNIWLTVPRRYFFCGSFMFFVLSCVCYVFVRVCLYVLCGHLLGKGWPLNSRLWCLLWVCHFPIGILGQVWYLIVSIPDLCTLTYFE